MCKYPEVVMHWSDYFIWSISFSVSGFINDLWLGRTITGKPDSIKWFAAILFCNPFQICLFHLLIAVDLLLGIVLYICTWILRHSERRRENHTTQHNTTQDLRQLFSKKKLHSRWIWTHTSCILGVMLCQLNYWGSSAEQVQNHLCCKAKQNKARISTW